METITLTISAQTLNTIGAALQEISYKIAKPAIDEIDKQVQEHVRQREAGETSDQGST
jgi:hypothetical protein